MLIRALLRWLAGLCGAALATCVAAQPAGDVRVANQDLIREQMAYHVGALAYVWGYPMVDMSAQMHNETHRSAADQVMAAPVNHFYRLEALITPDTMGNLRAPNHDTLYFGGWFDLAQGPVIVHAPDTAGRYYTLAVTDFFNEVTHLGRRTTGTRQQDFALVGPGFKGKLPAGVKPVRVATQQVWILGRLLVDGEADLPAALKRLRGFWAAPLANWQRGRPPAVPPLAEAPRMAPMATLEFYRVLNRWLRNNAARPDEAALVAQMDQVGFGPATKFDPASIDAATRRGLERGLADGQALMRATANRPRPDVRNGWVFPLDLADYGHDYVARAGVVFGGYANRPEESTYAALTADPQGKLMSGAQRYRLRFAPGSEPPVGAFWSITAYDLATPNFSLVRNPAGRYRVSDRGGLARAADGSFEILIQKERPPGPVANWLPVGDGPFMLIARLYEPGPAVLDGRYRLPAIEVLP